MSELPLVGTGREGVDSNQFQTQPKHSLPHSKAAKNTESWREGERERDHEGGGNI